MTVKIHAVWTRSQYRRRGPSIPPGRRLKSGVPAVNVVGYFTDPDSGLVTDVSKLLGAEYAFAPRILGRQSQFPQQWMVGDFSRRVDLAGFARTHGFRIVGDFGDGIVLFKRNGDQ